MYLVLVHAGVVQISGSVGVELVDEDQEQGQSNFSVWYTLITLIKHTHVALGITFVFIITWVFAAIHFEGGKLWHLQPSKMLQLNQPSRTVPACLWYF